MKLYIGKIYGFSHTKITYDGSIIIWKFDLSFKPFVTIFVRIIYEQNKCNLLSSTIFVSLTFFVRLQK